MSPASIFCRLRRPNNRMNGSTPNLQSSLVSLLKLSYSPRPLTLRLLQTLGRPSSVSDQREIINALGAGCTLVMLRMSSAIDALM